MRIKRLSKIFYLFYAVMLHQALAQWLLKGSFFLQSQIDDPEKNLWSKQAETCCDKLGGIGIFGGIGPNGFGNGASTTTTLKDLPNHTKAKISFSIYYLQSEGMDKNKDGHDDEDGLDEDPLSIPTLGTDIWKLTADGIEIIKETFPDFSKKPKTYCQQNTLTKIATYKAEFEHSDSNLMLTFADQFASKCEEKGWGIRDLKIFIKICHFSCKKCSGLDDQCLTCGENACATPDKKYCQCNSGYYASYLKPFGCSICRNTCLECSGGEEDDCTKCKSNAALISGKCICNAGYRANTTGDCVPCHFTCKECSGPSSNQCNSCYCGGALNYNKECKCLSGYSLASNIQTFTCEKCADSCEECNKENMNICTQCTKNASIDSATSQCACDQGFFAISKNPLRCIACEQSCKTCTALFQCSSCFENAEVLDGKCVCKSGFVLNPANKNTCIPCNGNCKQCSAQNFCTSCIKNAFIIEGTCKCMDGFYPSIENGILQECKKCQSTCLKCSGPNQNNCTDCHKMSNLITSADGLSSSCQCKDYLYMASELPFLCQPCLTSCQSCSSPTKCTTCFDNVIKQSDGTCKCKPGMFFNEKRRACETCERFCQECKSDEPTKCLTCLPNSNTILNPDGKCVPKIGCFDDNSGEIKICHESCADCCGSGNKRCTACKGALQLINGSCTCGQGKFPDPLKPFEQCNTCDSTCAKCTGPLSNQCTECSENLISDGKGSCLCDISNGWFITNSSGSPKCTKCHMNCKTCNGPTANECLICKDGQTIQNGQCICSPGFFPSSPNPLKCSKCSPQCKACSNANENTCTECFDNATLSSGSCICNPSYFYDEFSLSCQKCSCSCAECKNDEQNCTKCTKNAGLINGACISKDGFTFNPTNGLCEQCNGNCIRCSYLDKNTCTQCTDNAILDGNDCKCARGFYQIKTTDSSSLKCEACHGSCATCQKNNQSTSCTSCDSDFFTFFPNKDDISNGQQPQPLGQCKCRSGLFQDPKDESTCKPCSTNCGTCLGSSDNCTSCPNQNQIIQKGICVCPPLSYQDQDGSCISCHSSCGSCTSPSDNSCIICRDNTFILNKGICSCPPGFTTDPSGATCIKCLSNCKTCAPNSPNQCLSCNDTGIIHPTLQICICPPGTFSSTDSSSSNEIFKCQPCSQTCAECQGKNSNQCLSCPKNASLQQNGTCKCEDGYYNSSSDISGSLKCSKCSDKCNTCSGSADTCTSCFCNQTLLPNKTCTCEQGLTQNLLSDDNCCLKCDFSCQTCSGTSYLNCLSCGKNASLKPNGSCICNSGYFLENYAPYGCEKCHNSCAECFGNSINQCISCSPNSILVGNSCICEEGYFFDKESNICKKCSDNCTACSISATNCTACNSFSILTKNSKCICNAGYYANPNNLGECLSCNTNCLTCSNSSTFCTSCAGHSTLNPTKNICECETGYYLSKSSTYFNCQKCNCNCKTCDGSATNCISCSDPNSSINPTNNTCNCNSGYYIASSQPSLKCEKCDLSCKECTKQSSNQCTQCFENATLSSSNECICNNGYYMDTSTKKCKPCNSNCKTCSNSPNQCTSCTDNASIIDKQCICNKGFFIDIKNPIFQCQACSNNCKECQTSSTTCTLCKDNATLSSATNSCICNQGFYQDSSTGSCKPCSSSCKNCNSSSNSDQCTQCYENSELTDQIIQQNGITTGSCECKQHYYSAATLPTLQCQPCDQNCSSCSGKPSNCETCYQFASLTASKTCSCSPGYYLSSSNPFKCSKCSDNCATCNNSATTCTTCKENATLTSSNTCSCDNGFFNADNICQKCSPECKTCSDSSKKCTSCFSDSTYDATNNKCLCLAGTYRDNLNISICKPCDKSCSECSGSSSKSCSQCSQNAIYNDIQKECICNDGFFKNYNSGEFCLPCDKTCATCNETGSGNCITCKPNTTPCSSSTPHSCTCQDGFIMNISTGNCDACNPKCATCNGTASNNCITCKSNATVSNGECTCNDGYYLNPISLNCEKCEASCSTCSGPLKTDCTSCTTNALCPSGGKGICQCAAGYFFDSQWLCQPCDASCLNCSGQSASSCTSCKTNAHPDPSNPTTCICDDSYFMLNGTCKKCDSSCATCKLSNSPNSCITCKPNATLSSNNSCQCNTGFYLNTADSTCKPCDSTCKTCVNSSTNCLSCYENQHLALNTNNNENTCICDSRYYISGSSPIQQCSICHSTCKECKKGSPQDCSPFADNSSYPITGLNSECKCKKGFYASSTSPILICSTCIIPNCLDCSSLTSCNECKPNYILKPDGSCKVKDGMCDDPNGGDPKNCFPTCKTCTGPLASQCSSCYDNADLNQASECPCLSNYYRTSTDSIALSTCKPCDATCATCSGPASTDCKSCKLYATYDGRSCTCNNGYFFDSQTSSCQPCDSTCATCSQSASKCISCKSNAQLISSTSACKCNDGYFWNSPLSICSKCDDQCQTCSGSPSNCLSCRADSTLQSDSNSCKCLPGTYRDLLDGSKCKKCALTCKTCSLANQCDTCIDHATLIPGNSLCTIDCHYYLDPPTNTAPQCHPQCKNCSGPLRTDCIECYDFAHLNPSGLTIRTCDCDAFYFYATPAESTALCTKCHDSCGSCNGSNSNNCLTCKSTLAKPIQGICTCPEGYFMTPDFQCTKCNSSCKTCSGPGENQCTSCCSNATFDSISSKCTCNAHFFRNQNNSNECTPCHETCNSCIDSQIDACSTCYDGAALIGSKCICKSNYFYDQATKKCIKCLDQCKTCQNATTCLTCIDTNATISSTTGLCSCNSNFFYDSLQTKTCIACSKTCQECSGQNDNQCTKCYPNSNLSSTNQCICNPGYFKDPINPSNCLKCDGTCKTCMDAATTCISCKPNACLVKNKCQCNDGFYFDDLTTECKPCFSNCRQCSNSPAANKCTDCYESQIVALDGTCKCANGFFQNPLDLKKCQACHPTCATCSSNTSSSCLTCSDANMIVSTSGACICKPTFFLLNGVCTKCADRCNSCSSTDPCQCSECIQNASLSPSNSQTPSILTCQCNSGFYYNATNGKCAPCHSSCGKCNGPLATDCTACSSTTILFNRQCICKQGYYSDANDAGKCKTCDKTCVTCSGPLSTNCTSCSLYAKLSTTKTCECNEGTYRNPASPSQCLSCHSDCKTCIDGSRTSCTSCKSSSAFNMYFTPSTTNPKIGTCGCQDGYQFISCSLGNYCRACHSTCRTCSGTSSTECQTCYPNATKQSNGSCKCSDGFFLASDGKSCQPCDPSCETCGGSQPNQCTTCPINAILSCGNCQCKQSFFANEKGICSACPSNCKICSNASTCTTCQTGYGVIAGQCQLGAGLYLFNPKISNIQSLQAKASLDTQLSVVAKCHQSCFSCSGPHANECLSCHENSLFDLNSRQCKCKEGFFENLGRCHACSPACSSCSNQKSTSCTACIANATFDKTSKICTCNNGFVFSQKKKICEKVFQSTTECNAILQSYLPSTRVTAVAASTKILNSFAMQLSLDYKHSPIPKECSTYVQFGIELHLPRNQTWVPIPQSLINKQQTKSNTQAFSETFIISYEHIVDIMQVDSLPKSITLKVSTISSDNEEQSSHYFDVHFNKLNQQIVITRSSKKHQSMLVLTDLTEEYDLFSNHKKCDTQNHPECYVLTDIDTDSFICSNADCTHHKQQLHFSAGERIYVIMKFKDSSNTSIISKKTVNLISNHGQITDLTDSVDTISSTTESSIFSVKLPNNADNLYLQIIAEVVQDQPSSDTFLNFGSPQKQSALTFADFPQLSVFGSDNDQFSSGLIISGSIMSFLVIISLLLL